MGFFLVGRGREAGDLRLISSELYPTRSEALDALTVLSGDPAFAHRDAEVFVVDLDSGVPVLLVAAAPVAEAVPAGPEPEATPEADTEPEPDAEPEAELEAEPEREARAEEGAADDAGVWEAPVEVESAIAEAVSEAADADDLAGALKRAAGALESEGIVAPESIGPSEPVSVLDQPWLAEIGEESSEESVEPEAEPEPQAEPEAEPEPEPEPEAEPEAEPEPEAEAAWPWDTATGSEAGEAAVFVPDPFEEPAADVGNPFVVTGEDDTVVRTVVMGAYAEESVPAPVAAESAAVNEPAGVAGQDTEIDSILADLGPVETPEPAQAAAPEPVSTEGETSIEDLTCDDCVYVNTCPNKEGLDPAKCGNFQWRSV